jgi:transposase-like protein
MSLLSQKHLQDEEAAYAFVEAHVWPDGPVCPHCGSVERISKMKGKATRAGLYKCYACRRQFRVTVGTIFEASHIPLRLWLQAMFLLAGSKKGISSNQLHRTLGITLKSAWFMSHRIREAMRKGALLPPMGGNQNRIVEADETFIGRKQGVRQGRSGYHHKNAVLTLIDRTSGEARSFHIDNADAANIVPIVRQNIARETAVVTDEANYYSSLNCDYFHASVNHGQEEWAVGEFHTNSVEGYYSIFKRGMKGIYQHCSEKHLHRYLAEYDFRYSNRAKLGVDDEQRAAAIVKGVKGKRLTYRTAGGPRPGAPVPPVCAAAWKIDPLAG